MKTDANDLAFPFMESNANGDYSISTGLTKREYFAAMAMQGILANPEFASPTCFKADAECAINAADALIEELGK